MDQNRADRCSRCGCRDIHHDEVFHRGMVLLAECGRCQQRWTCDVTACAAAPRRVAAPADGLGPAGDLAA